MKNSLCNCVQPQPYTAESSKRLCKRCGKMVSQFSNTEAPREEQWESDERLFTATLTATRGADGTLYLVNESGYIRLLPQELEDLYAFTHRQA